jgi:predicted  nucleic acid-binding Zn-ribbon protein
MNTPNGEPRLERLEQMLIESTAEFNRRAADLDRRMEVLHVNIESLHASVSELHASVSELRTSATELRTAAQQDGENIRALARIAEIHERRLSDLEKGST